MVKTKLEKKFKEKVKQRVCVKMMQKRFGL
jgi:hypothetical protein